MSSLLSFYINFYTQECYPIFSVLLCHHLAIKAGQLRALSASDGYVIMLQHRNHYFQTTNAVAKTVILYLIQFTLLKSQPWLKTIDAMPSI
jgi:hypothetical protein